MTNTKATRRSTSANDGLEAALLSVAHWVATHRGHQWAHMGLQQRKEWAAAILERLEYLATRLQHELTAARLFDTFYAASVVPPQYVRIWQDVPPAEQQAYATAVNAFFSQKLGAAPIQLAHQSARPARPHYPFVATSTIAYRLGAPGASPLYVHLACIEEFAGEGVAISAAEIVLGHGDMLYFPGEDTGEVTDRSIETTCCGGCGLWFNDDDHLVGLDRWVKQWRQAGERQ